MYQIKNEIINGTILGQSIIKQNADSSLTSFAIDPANTDYQEYLKWVAEGNEPLPADNE